MAERFFRVTTLAGGVHLLDLHDWEPWDANRIEYRSKAEIAWPLRIRGGGHDHRVIRTVAELDAVLTESAAPSSVSLYVREDLLDETRRQWETMKTQRKH